jgi:hypothetical protein
MVSRRLRSMTPRGPAAAAVLLLCVAAAAAAGAWWWWRRTRLRQERYIPAGMRGLADRFAAVPEAAPAPAVTWACPPGFSWTGSKEAGKECGNSSGRTTGTVRVAARVAGARGPAVKAAALTGPADRAVVYYNNGRKLEVFPYPRSRGDEPITQGLRDRLAGGIRSAWVPPGMALCLKNRRRVDSVHRLNSGRTYDVPAKNDADDIWLLPSEQRC